MSVGRTVRIRLTLKEGETVNLISRAILESGVGDMDDCIYMVSGKGCDVNIMVDRRRDIHALLLTDDSAEVVINCITGEATCHEGSMDDVPLNITLKSRRKPVEMNDHYVGSKIIKAKPMNRLEYNVYRGWELPADENGADEGYLVEYTDGGQSNHKDHVGYISWSPKKVFDGTYLPIGELGQPTPAPFALRLLAEVAENRDRLRKLESFLDVLEGMSEELRPVDEEMGSLLRIQSDVMDALDSVLNRRLELLDLK